MTNRCLRGGVLLLTLLLGLCLCGIALADGSAADADQLKTLIEQGGTITLSSNITLDGPLMVNADTVLDFSKHTIIFTKLTKKDGSAIQVAKDVSLTLENGTLKTNTLQGRAILADKGGSTIKLDKMTISWFVTEGNGGAVLLDGGTLIVDNTLFGDEKNFRLSAANGGAIYANNSKVSIQNSRFSMTKATCVHSKSQYWYGGGAIFLSGEESSGSIKSSSFSKCKSDNYGIAIHLDEVGGEITLDGNTIQDCASNTTNKWVQGGGIYVRFCKKVLLSNNTIKNNVCRGDGGGVKVLGGGPTTITFRGNIISNNQSTGGRGGGISLSVMNRDTVNLESGIICDNKANDFGGGIDYTGHDMPTLQLKNVFISDNEAVRGAGIWCCPTSTTEMYSTVGGAIVGNTVSGKIPKGTYPELEASGDDIRYENVQDSPDNFATVEFTKGTVSYITVTGRAFNGVPITWYKDEAEDRYEDGDSPIDLEDYQNYANSLGLHGETAEDLVTALRNEATLIITGNNAVRGGGIATNSPIQIGKANADVQVTVRKVWTEKEHPTSVKVDLYRVDADGTKVKLDRDVELNAENEWQAVFANLPAYTLTRDGEKSPYTYEVKEQPVDGWITAAEITSEDDGRSILVTLTNSPEPTVTPPKTGDASTPALWLMLTALSAAAMLTLALRRRRA